MLVKSKRLSTRQFNEVMKKGRFAHSPLFMLRILTNKKGTRIAAVAPQKIAKKAVTRNRIRRRMYEAVKPFMGSIVSDAWLIIFAKKDVSDTEFNELVMGMKILLDNSNLYYSRE